MKKEIIVVKYYCDYSGEELDPKTMVTLTLPNNEEKHLSPSAYELFKSEKRVKKEELVVLGLKLTFIKVEAGEFTMGYVSARDGDAFGILGEKPSHKVYLNDFYILETPVTQKLWDAVGVENNSLFPNEDCPVNCVSWRDAQEFIAVLKEKTGLSFRLPTEAEWEYAGRGGHLSRFFTYSGDIIVNNVAWFGGNCNKPMPVKQKSSNELELYDMSGNVWEWCQDWYNEAYYSVSPEKNPAGASYGTQKVIRGGAWDETGLNCRLCIRRSKDPLSRDYNTGLRLIYEKSHS